MLYIQEHPSNARAITVSRHIARNSKTLGPWSVTPRRRLQSGEEAERPAIREAEEPSHGI
jgi:hypothetical protein